MYLDYFFKKEIKKSSKLTPSYYIKKRKNRKLVKGTLSLKFINIGDIMEFVYVYKSIPLIYKGICIAIRRRFFIKPDVTLILRNIIMKIAIELTISYYYNRLYKLKFLDYKRKFYYYNRNRLFFLRERVNRESQVD
jgi:ribosomal protein L19